MIDYIGDAAAEPRLSSCDGGEACGERRKGGRHGFHEERDTERVLAAAGRAPVRQNHGESRRRALRREPQHVLLSLSGPSRSAPQVRAELARRSVRRRADRGGGRRQTVAAPGGRHARLQVAAAPGVHRGIGRLGALRRGPLRRRRPAFRGEGERGAAAFRVPLRAAGVSAGLAGRGHGLRFGEKSVALCGAAEKFLPPS